MQGVPEALVRPALTKTLISCLWHRWGRSSTYLLFKIYCNGTRLSQAPCLLFSFLHGCRAPGFPLASFQTSFMWYFYGYGQGLGREPYLDNWFILGFCREVSVRCSYVFGTLRSSLCSRSQLLELLLQGWIQLHGGLRYINNLVTARLRDSVPIGSLQWSSSVLVYVCVCVCLYCCWLCMHRMWFCGASVCKCPRTRPWQK